MTTTIGSLDLSALNNLYDETQYFWFESSAQPWGAGAHVTLYPQSEFTTSTHANYLKGQNILMNTDGFSLRNGTLPMMTLDNDSLDFNVVDTTAGTYVTTATFTSTSARIGQNNAAHSVIDVDGQRFYASDGTTQLANIGYGEGASQSGTATAPYYTFGIRVSGSTIGNYSMAEGVGVTASGYSSHAEGYYATASGSMAHAEGYYTTASSADSHAEGGSTTASGYASHAEGYIVTASGEYSHAQNQRTIAAKKAQTVLGSYNEEDTSTTTTHPSGDTDYGEYALIIGNGASNNARSNALIVDWSGNVIAAGNIVNGSGETLRLPTITAGATTGSITLGDVLILWGNGNITTGSSGTTTGGLTKYSGTLSVTFSSAFAKSPVVVATWAGSYANQDTFNTHNKSTTGVDIVGRTLSASQTRSIQWLAIGKKA